MYCVTLCIQCFTSIFVENPVLIIFEFLSSIITKYLGVNTDNKHTKTYDY